MPQRYVRAGSSRVPTLRGGRRDHLLALARGEVRPQTGKRRHRRLPIEIRVDWRVPQQTERHISLVDDIGIGGAFLRTLEQPAEGTPVVIELCPPGANTPQAIEGRVAWRRDTPGHEGVGVVPLRGHRRHAPLASSCAASSARSLPSTDAAGKPGALPIKLRRGIAYRRPVRDTYMRSLAIVGSDGRRIRIEVLVDASVRCRPT